MFRIWLFPEKLFPGMIHLQDKLFCSPPGLTWKVIEWHWQHQSHIQELSKRAKSNTDFTKRVQILHMYANLSKFTEIYGWSGTGFFQKKWFPELFPKKLFPSMNIPKFLSPGQICCSPPGLTWKVIEWHWQHQSHIQEYVENDSGEWMSAPSLLTCIKKWCDYVLSNASRSKVWNACWCKLWSV